MAVQGRESSSRFQLELMWSRIKRVSRLDRDEILELKQNKNATGQAVAVLVVAALALGVGNTLFTELQSNSVSAYGIIVGSLASIVTGCFAEFVWSGTLFLVGTKLFQGKTGYWEVARPLFSSVSPACLFILISIPAPLLYKTVTIITTSLRV